MTQRSAQKKLHIKLKKTLCQKFRAGQQHIQFNLNVPCCPVLLLLPYFLCGAIPVQRQQIQPMMYNINFCILQAGYWMTLYTTSAYAAAKGLR